VRRALAASALLVVLGVTGCGSGPVSSPTRSSWPVALPTGDDGRFAQPAIGERDAVPAGLTPKLLRSMTRAIVDARAEGVELTITSGWRSAAHQQRLFEEAVRKYGSRERARQWVLPPEESAHVTGAAVDVGPPAGAAWLRANGERYGLCQRYANEPWHFERLAGAIGSHCPALQPHA
jgi:hypothetical protein